MQVKVFEAPDMTSGLKQVKEAFGPDALILSTRTIRRGGKLGLMGKPMLEITAAIDNDWPPQEKQPGADPYRHYAKQTTLPQAEDEELSYDTLWDTPEPPPKTPPPQSIPPQPDHLQEEIAALKDTIAGLTRQVSSIQAAGSRPRPSSVVQARPAALADQDGHLCRQLREFGINERLAASIADQAMENLRCSPPDAQLDEQSALKGAIAKSIVTQKVLQRKLKRQKRISLIGPTGVGKTTTIAKLAANYLSRFGGKVALFTIDTYRIAAVEQLKVYGEIMRLPVEVILKPQEVDQLLDKYSDYDLILIDTAGRSHRNAHDLAEMASFFSPGHGIEHHLLLSSVTREYELLETVENFSVLPISTFIFSKIDECDQLGIIANIHNTISTPISFLTNGQRVPEDIIAPHPATIANLIVNDQRTLHDG